MIVCEWGLAGVEAWRGRARVLVIVDVLSFSTAVDIAVSRGAQIVPFVHGGDPEAAAEAARAAGAMLAASKRAKGGQLSLSPQSLFQLEAGQRLMLPSPNGSRLSLAGEGAIMLCGSLRNAAAVAARAAALANGGTIAVIAAGERWPDGHLRPAIEDLIGAGAVIDGLKGGLSPEALTARDAYRAALPVLAERIRDCISGQELIERGFAEDVALASALNVSTTAPLLRDGAYGA